uniref:RRM domain-containing protein n=1 Tax=Acrobeloides nanus TaxID=290746 RepID=A0A914E636_9BILA
MRLAIRLFSARGRFLADPFGAPVSSQQKDAQQTSATDENIQGQNEKATPEKKPQKKFYMEVRCAPSLTQREPERSRPLFISHMKWITGQTQLENYFSKYGNLKDISLYFDANTGLHKGYASVTFESPKSIEKVLKDKPHVIDGDIINVEIEAPRTHNKRSTTRTSLSQRHSISF